MIRKQLYISEELERGLKALAARTGRAEAHHVREALSRYLDDEAPLKKSGEPLRRLAGLVADADGPDDVAEEHDHYLYGAAKRSRGSATE